jgi:hypothetical protein
MKPGGAISPRFLLFFGSFSLILAYSLSPTVYAGDSSLFSASSFHLGTAHPPAYPLFNMLGKIATFIPAGNVGMKVNILSALLGALTVLVSYESALYLTGNRLSSMFAPMAVLASAMFVLESSKAEVYTLNAFLVMLVFYLGLRVLREKVFFREIMLCVFIVGLGMGNHHSIVFVLPLALYASALRARELPRWTVALCLIFSCVGFSVYLYPYLRSIAPAFVNYSKVPNFDAFLINLLRMDYQSGSIEAAKAVTGQVAGWLPSVSNLAFIMSRELNPIVWVLVAVGFIGFVRNRRLLAYLLLSLFIWLPLAKITISGYEMTYRNVSVTGVYFLPIIPMLATVSACGVHRIQMIIKSRSALVSGALIASLAVFQALQITSAIQRSSLSDYYIGYNMIKDVSKVLGPKSIYFIYGDNPAFLSFYGFGVERLRDDVLTMDSLASSKAMRITISPPWKYRAWYPELYEKNSLSANYFMPYAKDRRLYLSSANVLPSEIRLQFDLREHVLNFIALPPGSDYSTEERFREDFGLIDYLPVALGHRKDSMTENINNKYSFTIWYYAKLLARDGHEDAEYYYRLSFLLADRKLKYPVLIDYLKFVAGTRGADDAQRLLSELKETVPAGKDREVVEELQRRFNSMYPDNAAGVEAGPAAGSGI